METRSRVLLGKAGRRQLFASAGGAAAGLVGASVAGTARAAEQTTVSVPSLTGLWVVGFLRRDPPPGAQRSRILTSFMPDGGVVVALNAVTAAGDGTRPQQSTGVGWWDVTGERSFTYIYAVFLFDEGGAFQNQLIARQSITLDEDGDGFSGTFLREDRDIDGTVVFQRDGTVEGRRIVVP